jgi:hypothetical protein
MRNSRRLVAGSVVLAAALTGSLVFAVAASGNHRSSPRTFSAGLNGYQEIPSISTLGGGQLTLRVNGGSVQYRLAYRNLEGTAQQAHIHLGRRESNGGVIAFLCGGGNKPACPASGAITGTITAADIQPIPAQGIAAGELAELVRAIRASATYANVHTTSFASGEIRGQIVEGNRGARGDRDDDRD